jgi:enoyl-CoA hydratase/carnithine racemase
MLQTTILNRSPNHTSIGHATLDRPKALNALSLKLIDELSMTLRKWQNDTSIDAVILDSSLERAFCAGGDVKALINYPGKSDDERLAHARVYFQHEYALDHLIHTYSKPLICWGDGFILGGGMGLFQGASCRITTERSILAMPEIGIGLFPDVGASYFLNRLPEYLGLFLGITGYKVSGTDALLLGLTDHLVTSTAKAGILEELVQIQRGECLLSGIHEITHSASRSNGDRSPTPDLSHSLKVLQSLIDPYQFWPTIERLRVVNQQQDPLLNPALLTAIKELFNGSVLSACLTWHHLRNSRALSLPECFREDLKTAMFCFQHGDFAEGVRARLIDKDFSPKWRFSWNDSPEKIEEYIFSKIDRRRK